MDTKPFKLGVIIAHGRSSPRDSLVRLARQVANDAAERLEEATEIGWNFRLDEPMQLESDERRHAGDFIGEASLRLVEGSFDIVVIITDVPLISRRERIVFGLASPLARTIVLSTHRLRDTVGGERLPNDAQQVRYNGAALLLHLITTVLGASETAGSSGPMTTFAMDADRHEVPRFNNKVEMQRKTAGFARRELSADGPLQEFWQHLRSAARHPSLIGKTLLRNRAPLLPLRMPGLATAAVAPVFVLVFSAEFWDAGLGMSHATAWAYAAISIVAAALYLCFSKRLFLPRKESRIIPEHLAVANVVIFLSMSLAVVGLFAMVAALALALALFVFPSDLIATWPTLEDREVGMADLTRIAVFISTVGVTTGALAGGMHRRRTLRQIALFSAEV